MQPKFERLQAPTRFYVVILNRRGRLGDGDIRRDNSLAIGLRGSEVGPSSGYRQPGVVVRGPEPDVPVSDRNVGPLQLEGYDGRVPVERDGLDN